ncbi:hypothetical protein PEPS_37650 (plasmid) [Persicobacter psychrovividus]|uniref:Uncharacterized protein n=1 Tax=Persicobacter psychrovividus TaxID=387638 RepID=A0ABN6LE82_9BACT|nr:hypothetical protein PEPS_37650 [Persicobacter psychrovividus]
MPKINSPSIFLTKILVVVESILAIETSETFEFTPLLSSNFLLLFHYGWLLLDRCLIFVIIEILVASFRSDFSNLLTDVDWEQLVYIRILPS